MGVEQEKVGKEKDIADTEEKKVAKINIEVSKKQKDCEEDLAKAEPALKAAAEALNTLNKANLTELKSFGKPPPAVMNVTAGVMVLLAPASKIPKDRSWNSCKIMMAKVDQFLDSLINFDKENIQDANLKAVDPYLANPEFDPDFIRSKSFAAAGTHMYYTQQVYVDISDHVSSLSVDHPVLPALPFHPSFLPPFPSSPPPSPLPSHQVCAHGVSTLSSSTECSVTWSQRERHWLQLTLSWQPLRASSARSRPQLRSASEKLCSYPQP